MFTPIFLVFHILLAIALIALILVQQGKGAEAGAAFGSGASNTMFGSRGNTSALTKLTAVLATLFFVTSLAMAWQAQRSVETEVGIPKQEIIEEQNKAATIPLLDESVKVNTDSLDTTTNDKTSTNSDKSTEEQMPKK